MFAASSYTPSVLLLDISLLAILVIVAFAIVRMRSLFGIVMLQGVYSLISAAWFVSLDAVDVAFTEAAVGAGVSTVLMLSAMLLADRKSAPVPLSRQWGPLLICIFAGAAMFYAIGDMPAFGDGNSPANSYVGMEYMARTADEVQIPNVVTAVLGSYRGYDTFGEAVVIFSAGLGVLLLLGLNGNAGRWRAQPNGRRVSAPSAPAAHLKREGVVDEKPEVIKAPVQASQTQTTLSESVTVEKAPAKKVTVKKTATKRAPARKTAAKKATTRKAPPTKSSVTKSSAAKSPATKSGAKTTVKKATTAKKPAAKKATAVKKTTPKKPATKAAAVKTTKKAAPKKTATAQKTVTKKTTAKTTRPKGAAAKKAPRKSTGGKA